MLVTPSDLRAYRMLTGLSLPDAASMLNVTERELRDLERMKGHTVYAGHALMLRDLVGVVDNELDAQLEKPTPRFLFGYPNDGAFRDYDPAMHKKLLFNSVHRMFLVRLLGEYIARDEENCPTVVDIVPTQYQEFLARAFDEPVLRDRQRKLRALEAAANNTLAQEKLSLARQDYEEWLDTFIAKDTPEYREAWADEYVQIIRVHNGLPNYERVPA